MRKFLGIVVISITIIVGYSMTTHQSVWAKKCESDAHNCCDCVTGCSGVWCCHGCSSCTKCGSGSSSRCNSSCPCTPSSPGGSWISGSAPSGWISQCKTVTSCSGTYSSCSTCGGNSSWYLPETNYAPAEPTGIYFCTGSQSNCTTVAGDISNPTVVVHDTESEDVFIKATGVIPSGSNSRGLRYKWEIDNLKDSFACGNEDDSCGNDVVDPNWPDQGDIVTEGDVYKATFWVGSIDRCTDNIQYGSPKTVYFVVDYNPNVIVTTPLDGLSGTEIDTDNGPTCNDNNPFTFNVTYEDLDGVDNLESLKFWIDDALPNRNLAQESVHGMVKMSGASRTAYGYSCDNSSNNCDWNVVGGTLPSLDRNICSVDGLWSDYIASSVQCTGSTGAWTATDISVDGTNTQVTVTFKSWIDEDIGTNLTVYAEGIDIHGAPSHWQDAGDWLLDLDPPEILLSDLQVIGSNTVKLPWSVSDTLSTVADLRGHAELAQVGYNNGPIYDETSGVNNYVITRTYDHLVDRLNPLWQVDNPVSRDEVINLLNNEGNEIDFWATAHDFVCNESESNHVLQDLDSPWLITRGGNVYSTAGTNLNTQAIEDDNGSTVYGITKDNSLWVTPFRYEIGTITDIPSVNNDIAASTELYLVGPSASLEITDTYLPASGYGVTGYKDSSAEDLYSTLVKANESAYIYDINVAPVDLGMSSIDTGTYPNSTSLPSCDNSKEVCVFSSTDLTITTTASDTPFTCDKPTVFMLNGNLSLQPDILKGNGVMDGCMFVVSGNITIESGMDHDINIACNDSNITDADICYPAYDTVEAMLLADGQIILETDKQDLVNEGLLIHGNVIASGGDMSESSIVWRRSQKLANNLRFPSVILHSDPVYYGVMREVFDMNYVTYNLDSGFRPL